jgi:hypothetical protein
MFLISSCAARRCLWSPSIFLGLKVASRDHGAQDRGGVPHDDIRSAPVQQLGELFEVQEVEDLRDRIVQESPDRRQAACMRYGSQGTVLIGAHRRGREQVPVELPDPEGTIWARIFSLLPKGLQGVGAGQVPVVALLVQV